MCKKNLSNIQEELQWKKILTYELDSSLELINLFMNDCNLTHEILSKKSESELCLCRI